MPDAIPPSTYPSSLPRRDRLAILIAMGGATAVAWAYLVRLALRMHDMHSVETGGTAMGGMQIGGIQMGGPMGDAMQIRAWSGVDFLLMFVMWAVMMVAMMVPTATRTTLLYAAVARKAERQGTPVAPTASFVGGYVALWTLFSVAATVAQWSLDQAALLSPRMVANSPWLGALLLGAAGVYQLTPAKDVCLQHCRSPALFFSAHWRAGSSGAFRMGAVHGAYCLGCCWALMGLLFFGGVMNLGWILLITLFVLAEKLLPYGDRAARSSGGAMIVIALLLGARWLGARWLGA